MKKLLIAVTVLAGIALSAAEVNVFGTFAQVQKNGFPQGWYANAWEGYKPAPKFEIITENGAKVIHFTEIKAKSGFGWASNARFAAKAGDKVTVTAKVKGAGTAWFGLQTFQANDAWTGVLPGKNVPLTKDWSEVKVELPVANIKDKATGRVMLTFGANQNADFYISNIKVDCTAK